MREMSLCVLCRLQTMHYETTNPCLSTRDECHQTKAHEAESYNETNVYNRSAADSEQYGADQTELYVNR